MSERKSGLIINVSSIAGLIAAPLMAVYHVSKWAVEGYSLTVRRELASVGVDVVVVEPGAILYSALSSKPSPESRYHNALTCGCSTRKKQLCFFRFSIWQSRSEY